MFDNQGQAQADAGKKKLFTKYIIPGLGILAVLSIVFAGSLYFAQKYTNVLGTRTNDSSTTSTPEEIEELVNKVAELILLPQGETPDIATVNDLSQVKSQDFFRNAEIGDKVLIYSAAKKAYLYRPSTHKLIEVGIVNQGTPVQDEGVNGAQDTAPEVITPTPFPTIPIDDQPTGTPSLTPTAEPTSSVLVTPQASPTP